REPRQLVIELRPRRRVPIGQVEASNQHLADRRLDIAAVAVVGITRQLAPCYLRLLAPSQNGDPIPALLPLPNRPITRLLDGSLGKLLLRRLEFLQANHVGL